MKMDNQPFITSVEITKPDLPGKRGERMIEMTEKKTSAAQLRAVQKYKEKVKRITIDFYPADAEIWEHIQQQPKKQTYIKDLIRADMDK